MGRTSPHSLCRTHYAGMEPDMGMWIGCSKGSEDPRRIQNAACLFEHSRKDTNRVRHVGGCISLTLNIKSSL